MTAEVATMPPTTSSFSLKDEEPRIYVSTATLQLKLKPTQPLGHDFQWQTVVVTPTDSGTTPAQKPVEEAEAEQVRHKQVQSTKPPSTQKMRFPPRPTLVEADNIFKLVGNFMASERYHSGCNWMLNHTLVNNAGGDAESSKV